MPYELCYTRSARQCQNMSGRRTGLFTRARRQNYSIVPVPEKAGHGSASRSCRRQALHETTANRARPRSTTVFYLGATMLGGAVLANPITYWVMERGTWLAINLGLGGMALTTVVGFCVPEIRTPSQILTRFSRSLLWLLLLGSTLAVIISVHVSQLFSCSQLYFHIFSLQSLLSHALHRYLDKRNIDKKLILRFLNRGIRGIHHGDTGASTPTKCCTSLPLLTRLQKDIVTKEMKEKSGDSLTLVMSICERAIMKS
jgi:hypothetical protein